MEELIIPSLIGNIIALIMFIQVRTPILNKMKYLLQKRKGAKYVLHWNQDGETYMNVQIPDREQDTPTVKHNEKTQKINKTGMTHYRDMGAPMVLALDGGSETMNPYDNQGSNPHTAQNIEQAVAYAELKGRMGAERDNEKIKKLLYIAIGAAALAAIVSILILNQQSELLEYLHKNISAIKTLIETMPKPL